MNELKMKAKAGVTLVELLVVILIVTILSVSMLPLLKPYIEQAKYAAEVQPALGNIQTKINLYQYEKDILPCTTVTVAADGTKTEDTTSNDTTDYGWTLDQSASVDKARVYKACTYVSGSYSTDAGKGTGVNHISSDISVTWEDLIGKRINPSHFKYHLIKGLGAAQYGYAIGVFGDGDGLAIGTGYAILVLVDTERKMKLLATWERYKPESNEIVKFTTKTSGSLNANECCIPDESYFTTSLGSASDWDTFLAFMKDSGWSFNGSDF